MNPISYFRRGVTVAASLIVGSQTALFGLWLMLPAYDTFGTSVAYAVMAEVSDEWLWGLGFFAAGSAVGFSGLAMWLRLWQSHPVPLWFRTLSAFVLLAKLIIVVSIFYLASRESPAAPLFAVMMMSVAVILISALDELGAYSKLAALRGRLWGD